MIGWEQFEEAADRVLTAADGPADWYSRAEIDSEAIAYLVQLIGESDLDDQQAILGSFAIGWTVALLHAEEILQ